MTGADLEGSRPSSRSLTPSTSSAPLPMAARSNMTHPHRRRPWLRLRRAQQAHRGPHWHHPRRLACSRPCAAARSNVSDTRVGQRTDYDKLVLEVETDGSHRSDRGGVPCVRTSSTSTWARSCRLADIADEEEGEEFRPSSRRRARRPTPSSTSRSRTWTFPSAPTTA